MALTIPERLHEVVLDIFSMEPSERNHIVDTLAEDVEPGSKRSKYQQKLTEILNNKPSEWINNALDFIFSITNLADTGRDLTVIEDDIVAALRKLDSEVINEAKDEDFSEFKAFVVKLTRSQDTLGLGAKAARLSLQHERVFVFSEIFSDMRSIFPEDVSSQPANAVIIHSLKIHSHKDDKHSETYFAMEHQDLIRLKKVVDRAIAKHETLSAMSERFGLRVIELGGDEQ